jgi:hypothetical protein
MILWICWNFSSILTISVKSTLAWNYSVLLEGWSMSIDLVPIISSAKVIHDSLSVLPKLEKWQETWSNVLHMETSELYSIHARALYSYVPHKGLGNIRHICEEYKLQRWRQWLILKQNAVRKILQYKKHTYKTSIILNSSFVAYYHSQALFHVLAAFLKKSSANQKWFFCKK